MISFEMTEEQRMLVETVRRFAGQKLRANSRQAEEERAVPDEIVQQGWELGLLPGSLDPSYGGFGEYSAVTSALYLEELGWGDVGISLHLLTPNLFALPISLFGTDEQKERYLPMFCGETFPHATAALIEPVFQFDPAVLATSATKEEECYRLSGIKTYVPLARTAEHFLIYANERGVTQAFIVPRATPGLHIGERVSMMGIHALDSYTLTLEDVRVPHQNRLGGIKGIRLERLLTIGRIALAALAVGQARAAHEYALAYAKEREAFGEPIAYRQSIAFMLANMRIEIEATRLLCWEAAYRFDHHEDATKSAVLAKQVADKMVLETTDGAVQILGGHGYVKDHPVELWLRNGRGFAAWEGLLLA